MLPNVRRELPFRIKKPLPSHPAIMRDDFATPPTPSTTVRSSCLPWQVQRSAAHRRRHHRHPLVTRRRLPFSREREPPPSGPQPAEEKDCFPVEHCGNITTLVFVRSRSCFLLLLSASSLFIFTVSSCSCSLSHLSWWCVATIFQYSHSSVSILRLFSCILDCWLCCFLAPLLRFHSPKFLGLLSALLLLWRNLRLL